MVAKLLEISIFEIVGTPYCVASGDGQKVFDRLSAILNEARPVALSFHNVVIVTSAFLNAAIGQLYGKFDEATIRALLTVRDMSGDDAQLLRRVVETAKHYFADPERIEQGIREAMGDGSDER